MVADIVARALADAGLLATPEHHAEIAAKALETFQPLCPKHGIPNCSPWLNLCHTPNSIHRQLVIQAALIRSEAGIRRGPRNIGGESR